MLGLASKRRHLLVCGAAVLANVIASNAVFGVAEAAAVGGSKSLSCYGFDDRIAAPTPSFNVSASVGLQRGAPRRNLKWPLLVRTDVASSISVRPAEGGTVWLDYGGDLSHVSEIRFPGCRDSGHDDQRPWGVRIGLLHTSKAMCVVITVTSAIEPVSTVIKMPMGRTCR